MSDLEEFNRCHPYPDEHGISSLFRFYKIDHARLERLSHIFIDRKLYHALPGQLNDPFECKPHFNWTNSKEQKRRIREHLIKVARDRGRSKKDAEKFVLSNMSNETFLRETIGSTVLKTFSEIRICSFTSKKENLLFWSHYADSHKGFCLEFDATIMPIVSAYKVHYQEDYPLVDYPRPTDARGFEPALIKSNHWEYEEEFRTIFVPEDEKQPSNDGESLILQGNEILNVYFGANTSNDDKEILNELIGNGPFNPALWNTRLSKTTFSLEFKQCN